MGGVERVSTGSAVGGDSAEMVPQQGEEKGSAGEEGGAEEEEGCCQLREVPEGGER